MRTLSVSVCIVEKVEGKQMARFANFASIAHHDGASDWCFQHHESSILSTSQLEHYDQEICHTEGILHHGVRLAPATMLEQYHHHGPRLRVKGTNGICAGVHTAREGGPSKYPNSLFVFTAVLLLCAMNPQRGAISKAIGLPLGVIAMGFCAVVTLKSIRFWSRSTRAPPIVDNYKNFSTLV
uniref:Transmembrane protein n=1 Tax=Angiostrongylus cantonensis TaxID=6313 RepID=A0A0K0DA29_ANGCA